MDRDLRTAWARRAGVALAPMLLLGATACGGGDDDSAGGDDAPAATTLEITPELREVIDAAEAEGKLLLSWQGVLGSVDGAPELIEGFEDYWGIDIDVTFTPGSGQGEMATKVEQERDADLDASTDILSLNASAVRQLTERGVVEEVDWAAFAPNVTPEILEADGAAVIVQSWVMGIAYNTDRVAEDEVPRSLEDLLDPALEGRIYTTPFGGGFDLLASEAGWGEERTLEFLRDFAGQIGGLGFNVQPLLSGETDILALLVPPGSALQAKDQGAPIDFLVPSDAALLYENLLGIPVNSAHPNAARLFVDYLVSPEGQAVLRQVDYADSPLVPGSLTAQMIDDATEAGAEFVEGDVTFYRDQDPDEYQRIADEIIEILLTRDG